MPRDLYVDMETRSEEDLKKRTTHRYAEHPSTEILLFMYAFDDGPVHIWDIYDLDLELPQEVLEALVDPSIVKWAHNAAFERILLMHCGAKIGLKNIPKDWIRQWRCSAVLSRYHSFPAALEKAAKAAGVPKHLLKKEGKNLIHRFCKPRRPSKTNPRKWFLPGDDPQRWDDFKVYGCFDVEAMRALIQILLRRPMPESEWVNYWIDQVINDRGLPVDLDYVRAAQWCSEENQKHVMALMRDLTGLENPNSTDQLLGWLNENGQLNYPNIQKETLEAAYRGESPLVQRVIDCRQALASAAVKKYWALEENRSADGTIKGCFQFYAAARTGRWGGKYFQPQNIASGYDDVEQILEMRELVMKRDLATLGILEDNVNAALKNLVRSAVAAPEGYELVVSDLSSIESIGLAWFANCSLLLDLFNRGEDTYMDFYSRWKGKPRHDVTPAERKYAKPPTLGCGFMLGAKGLIAYAEGFGVDMDLEEAQSAVNTYRQEYWQIPKFWYALQGAVFDVVLRNRRYAEISHMRIWRDDDFLFIRLPCGRDLRYFKPEIRDTLMPWGDYKPAFWYIYEDGPGKKWQRVTSHPGKITENTDQGFCNSLLKQGIWNAMNEGLYVVGHVHDEIICLARKEEAPETLKTLIRCMTDIHYPGLPIKAKGWHGPVYRKD